MRYTAYCAGCIITTLILATTYTKILERRYHKKLGH